MSWGDKTGMPWVCRYLSLHKWRRLRFSPVYQCTRCGTYIIRQTPATKHLGEMLKLEHEYWNARPHAHAPIHRPYPPRPPRNVVHFNRRGEKV
jgi:hypothetical protein